MMDPEWKIVGEEHRDEVMEELKPFFYNSLDVVNSNYSLDDLMKYLVQEGGISLVFHTKSRSGVILYDNGESGLELVIGAYRAGLELDSVGRLLESLSDIYNITTTGRKGWKKVGDKFGFQSEHLHDNVYKYTLNKKETELCQLP